MGNEDVFQNEILSMTTAQPGWTVHVKVQAHVKESGERWVDDEGVFPIVGWAVVACHYRDGGVKNNVEAVFVTSAGRLEHESFYRWQYTDLEPRAGEPKMTVSFAIREPGAE
ncbi:hypothetical protein ACGFZR_14915 [Streptomyces sp. NPDC048241]|uniref:hypothetical protein n=1 Tax=Streptomyces sp. NPDC048241 TaxID=3365521 RepID=UPI0037127179